MRPASRVRPALEALCRRVVPPGSGSDAAIDIASRVEERIASLDPPARRDLIGALHFFDHPITGMLLSGRPRRFSSLSPAEQDALLREWERSPIALRRTVFQALRRLILSTYYAAPETHPPLGVLPPLFRRRPQFAWEGPHAAPGGDADDDDGGPIADSFATAARPVSWPEGIVAGAALADGTELTADVCIIGSGAGGAVAAARLAAAGYDVAILEEGGFYTGEDFDDEEARLAPLLYADGAARGTDDLSFILLQGRCVGGGTVVNWLTTLRPMPWVLEEWEREHGLELLSERMLGPEMSVIEEAIHARPVPASAHAPSNRIILDGCARLGWRAIGQNINARGCVRAGACGLGCRWGAKQGAGDVFLPPALRAGSRLYCDVRAERIELLGRGEGTPRKRVRATILDRATRNPRGQLTVTAPIVVCAAGAVGTPALLERSGLGGGGVGRWLRLHPTTAVMGRYGTTMYGATGVPQSAVCVEFLRGDDGYGFWIECPPLRPSLAAAALQGFGDEHRQHMLDFCRLAALIVLVRDGAERGRCCGDVHVDRGGRPRIRYRMPPADRRALVRGLQAAARLHLVMNADHALTLHVGAQPIRSEADVLRLPHQQYAPNRISLFSAHVNGTCRMGTDPRESGCTPEGERHGVPGLYVADGSLFPTAPGVNPQLAIMTLASLVAGRIADRHLTPGA
jgi:choline dehydrogenase-like flavoprotein